METKAKYTTSSDSPPTDWQIVHAALVYLRDIGWTLYGDEMWKEYNMAVKALAALARLQLEEERDE